MTLRMPVLLLTMMCACSTPPSPAPEAELAPLLKLERLRDQIRGEIPPACRAEPRAPLDMVEGRDWREAAGLYRADAAYNPALLEACQTQLDRLSRTALQPGRPGQP
ncbi:hypothetical protein [Maricaulis sp.]|uniref:hypothetical protein n=1 Tax=Maricaulis sp. TaxID=1486257 RepID=UPI002634BF77|nr:hypothetical protein [Maricaulis sp.]